MGALSPEPCHGGPGSLNDYTVLPLINPAVPSAIAHFLILVGSDPKP